MGLPDSIPSCCSRDCRESECGDTAVTPPSTCALASTTSFAVSEGCTVAASEQDGQASDLSTKLASEEGYQGDGYAQPTDRHECFGWLKSTVTSTADLPRI